jgi:hypothetical protein
MAGVTPKGLVKPVDGENQDVAVLNGNMDRLDSYGMGPFVCTSASRPTGANLWTGMVIWETDTSRVLYYDGVKWVPLGGDDTGWIAPALTNAWVDYGGNYEPSGYRKLNGYVELRGMIKAGATGGVFTLPAGYRPSKVATFVVASASGMAIVAINSDSAVADGVVRVATFGTTGSNSSLSLRGIRFEAQV